MESRSYDAANQVSGAGFTYDAAGNLTNDGTTSYAYDALNRLKQRGSTTYASNGDGVMVSQTLGGNTTRYTQDLASPLSQILQITQGSSTTRYFHGLERLTALNGSTRTWYATDVLGSVRRTLSDSGTPGAPLSYDPWGTPQYGATPPTFGFTGELHDSASGMVNLRARWYHTGRGTFTSRDPFSGFAEQPYSLHPYQYGYSNPVFNLDPSGRNPQWPGDEDNEDDDDLFKCLSRGVGWYWDPVAHRCRRGPLPQPQPAPESDPFLQPFEKNPKSSPLPETTGSGMNQTTTLGGRRTGGNTDIVVGGGLLLACLLALSQVQTGDIAIPRTVPTGTPSKVIVELGAGDYSNAITMKLANPGARVIATNLLSEWELGRMAYEGGYATGSNAAKFPQVRLYVGWLAAKKAGVDVGTTKPYENQDVPGGIADFVYAIAPYPTKASLFGADAARIAKNQAGTVVAVTGGLSITRFEMGFNSVRPGSSFTEIPGAPFGEPHPDWEPTFSTLVHVVP
jgi:RHS repeat-associated protein